MGTRPRYTNTTRPHKRPGLTPADPLEEASDPPLGATDSADGMPEQPSEPPVKNAAAAQRARTLPIEVPPPGALLASAGLPALSLGNGEE
jgi:hypothetical protein